MNDTAAAILLIFLFLLVIPVLLLWTRDKIKRTRIKKSIETRSLELQQWQQRLLHPKFDEVEAVCGGCVPESLVQMYANKELMLQSRIEVHAQRIDRKTDQWDISGFIPMDAAEQNHTVDLSVGGWGKGCCFAGDGCGNFFWVPVSQERHRDAPVYFACHNPWGNTKVSDTLTEFLSWPRVDASQRIR
jgi:hypothetical protein